MTKTTKRLVLLIAFAVIIIFLVFSGFAFYKKEFLENPLSKAGDVNAANLYRLYILSDPKLGEMPYYGSQNASISMVAFLDDSNSSLHFIDSTFGKIDDDFISRGKIKFYIKGHLTQQDFVERSNKFLYAASLACMNSIKKGLQYKFYFDMIKNGLKNSHYLAQKYGAQGEILDNCIKKIIPDELREDALEVENFGISGVSPVFYIGIDGNDNTMLEGSQNYSEFNRTIRYYQFLIGN